MLQTAVPDSVIRVCAGFKILRKFGKTEAAFSRPGKIVEWPFVGCSRLKLP